MYAQRPGCEDSLCRPSGVVLNTSLTGPLQLASYVALGAEVPVYRQLAVQAEAIYIYKYLYQASLLAADRSSLGAKVDLKYYIPKSTSLRIYTGPSVIYRNLHTLEGRIEIRDEKDENGYDIRVPRMVMDDAAEVTTRSTDILWQVGIQPLILDHFALNLYTGAGIGILNRKLRSGPEPPDFKGKETYFSKLIGLQLGFAF